MKNYNNINQCAKCADYPKDCTVGKCVYLAHFLSKQICL